MKANSGHVFKRSLTNNSPFEDFTDLLFYGGQYVQAYLLVKF